MSEQNEAIIELINENGEPEQFEHIMTLEYKEHAYLIMQPAEAEDAEEGEVVVMSVDTDENGEEVYNIVEDPELAQGVFDEFLMILESDEADD